DDAGGGVVDGEQVADVLLAPDAAQQTALAVTVDEAAQRREIEIVQRGTNHRGGEQDQQPLVVVEAEELQLATPAAAGAGLPFPEVNGVLDLWLDHGSRNAHRVVLSERTGEEETYAGVLRTRAATVGGPRVFMHSGCLFITLKPLASGILA